MKLRSECKCRCHKPGMNVRHVTACCYPDPIPAYQGMKDVIEAAYETIDIGQDDMATSDEVSEAVLASPDIQAIRIALKSLSNLANPVPGSRRMLELHGLSTAVIDWVLE